MKRKIENIARYRFEGRVIAILPCWALITALIIWGSQHFHLHPTGILAYLFAALIAFPIVGLIVVFGLYLSEEKDEFQRNVEIQSLVWGIGATLIVTTFWGFLEAFGQVPHVFPVWVFTLFGFFMAISKLLVKLRYK